MRGFRYLLAAAVIGTIAVVAAACSAAVAATPNVTPGAGQVVVLPVSLGTVTADLAGKAVFKLPFPAKVLGISTAASASTGTSPTLSIDVNEGGTTILSGGAVAVVAATVTEGTIVDDTLADEASMTIDVDVGGTSPSFTDVLVLITLFRE